MPERAREQTTGEQPRTPPSGWAVPREPGSERSPEELLVELINLFRQLLAVAQALLDLLEQRVARGGNPHGRSTEHREVDIPIL